MPEETNTDAKLSNSKILKDTVTPRELFNSYRNYLPAVALSLAICLFMAYLYLHFTNPVYSSSIQILIDQQSDNSSSSNLADEIVSKLTSGGKVNISNELEIIKSKTLMEKVVRSLHLNQTYYQRVHLNKVEVYDSVANSYFSFDKISDSSKSYLITVEVKNGRVFRSSPNGALTEVSNNREYQEGGLTYSLHFKNLEQTTGTRIYIASWQPDQIVTADLASGIEDKQVDKEASIISVSIQTEVKQKGVDILNALAEAYAQQSVDYKNKTTDNTIKFVEDRLLYISKELGDVETKLQDYRQKNNIINPETQVVSALSNLNDLKKNMDNDQVKIQLADMITNYLNNEKRKFDLVPSSMGFEDATLADLTKSYNQDVLARESLLKTLTPKSIEVSKLEDQLNQLRPKILESIDNIKKALQSEYDKGKLEQNSGMAQLNSVPEKQKELLQIDRQQGIKEKLYLYLLEKREESAISKASAISNSRPVDPAESAEFPISPNKRSIYLLALLLGIGLPAGFIYLRKLFNDKVVTKADISNYTDLPIIGEIGHSGKDDRKIVVDRSRDIIAEQFRILRTNLQYISQEREKSTLLLTSSMPGEGKSFLSLNIGAVLAIQGKKTILLELDLRRPKLTEALGLKGKIAQGITTYLIQDTELKDIIVPVPGIDNYYFLPCGPVPPNPAELLTSHKMDTLFNKLKEQFDYIVIDCPPIGNVSDARVLSKYSDINLYIVRQRYTRKKQLIFMQELVEEGVFQNLAIIINDIVQKGSVNYYGYSGIYGYANSYSYNYNYDYGSHDGTNTGSSILKRLRNIFKS